MDPMKKVLALNYAATAALQRRYQLLVGALPMLCMFLPFVPLLKLAQWLDSPAGAAYDPIANGSPFVVLWGVLGLVVMVTAMLIGHASGWLLNIVISSLFLRWPWSRVRAVYLESQLPTHWYKAGIGSQDQADTAASQEWEAIKSKGIGRFVFKQGVLAWGAPMFIGTYLLPTVFKGQAFTVTDLLRSLCIWGAAGVMFGLSMWWWAESQHRKRSRL